MAINNFSLKIYKTFKVIFTLVLVLNFYSIHFASTGQKKKEEMPISEHYKISMATSRIIVDGILDEKAWHDAAIIKLPFEWRPGDNIPAPVDTDCLVVYDKNYFYVGFRCFDPDPSKIRAHLMDHDAIDTLIQDDHVVVMVDTFNDERRGFQFRVNPLGVQADANFSEMEGYEDFSWDAIWSSAGKITEWGYSIEVAIPFNQLRFPHSVELQTWGFSAERSYPRNVRHRVISHRRDRNVACILCQVNKITGFRGVTPGYNLEFDPTLTGNRTDEREIFPGGNMESGKEKAEPGLTVRWGITPNLILNATVNPDFSQVEADVAQLEINTRFALHYPEKRPFFLEGADFFLTPFEAVFTRTVADPTGGVKLTGKIGKNAVGFFGTYDRINNLIFPSNQGSKSTSINQNVVSGVLRYRRDVGQSSAVGFIYTGRAGEDYYNHVAGFDGFFRLSKTKTLNMQYLHSETDYPEEVSLIFGQKLKSIKGDALFVALQHQGRNWSYGFGYRDITPEFRADHGYIPRVDLHQFEGSIAPVFWGKKGDWYNMLSFGIGGEAVYDHDRNLTDQRIHLQGYYLGPLQSTVVFNLNRIKQLYGGKSYDLNQAVLFSELKPVGGLCFSLTGQYGDGVDYNNFRKAGTLYLMPFMEINLGRHINFNLRHSYERLGLKREEIYQADLSQVCLIYNFSVRTFVRAIIQYLDVSRNPELYIFPVKEKTKTFFTQFLFSYKLNPQTVFFIGYSDNYLGMTGIDIIQTDRTFFVKLGYAWTR